MKKIRTRRAVLAAAAALAALAGLGTAYANTESYLARFRDYPQGVNQDTYFSFRTPTRDAAGADAFPAVFSKWQQPRDVGTSPHQGTDLGTPKHTNVYPVYAGWIVYQSARRTDGTCCFTDANGANNWEMIIRLDWNNNSVQDDNVYLKYDHLERVGFKATGAYVSTADRVATSGDENGAYGAHLHFGLLYPREGQTGRWTSLNSHYTWATTWYNGDDLDYISFVYLYAGNIVQATSYVMSDGTYQTLPAGSVRLFHRRVGAGTWSEVAMGTTTTADRYTVDLDALGYTAGNQVQWFVRATRPNLTDPHNAAFFPAEFAHPNNNPNAVAAIYPSYTHVMQ